MNSDARNSSGAEQHGSLGSLRDRLSAIAARDIADRTLTPGEAESLIAVLDAVVEIAGYADTPGRPILALIAKEALRRV